MITSFVIACIVIAVVLSVTRMKKLSQERKEEQRREEEKMRVRRMGSVPPVSPAGTKQSGAVPPLPNGTAVPPVPPAQTTVPPAQTAVPPVSPAWQSAQNANPFPDYDADPFAGVRSEETGTLSPAQYNEWLLDFAAAERAGAPRPAKGSTRPIFARYLLDSGFSYRQLRKLCGYTPQNRLNGTLPPEKIKPAAISCLWQNAHVPLPPQESKSAVRHVELPQQAIIMPLSRKDVPRAEYESFYIGKD